MWPAEVVWCHDVTELKAGLLTRRLGSSVFCGRNELLLTWTFQGTTDQIVAVRPLKVLLHGAVIQSDPGVVMTKTCEKQQSNMFTWLSIFKYFCKNFDKQKLHIIHTVSQTTLSVYQSSSNIFTDTTLSFLLLVASPLGIVPIAFIRMKPNWEKHTHTHTHTVDKLLLCDGDDTTEVGAVLSAVFFCILPGVSVGEVPVGERYGGKKKKRRISYIMLPDSVKWNRAPQ